jgi:hypothetical protein
MLRRIIERGCSIKMCSPFPNIAGAREGSAYEPMAHHERTSRLLSFGKR